jgi:hypothetical protein
MDDASETILKKQLPTTAVLVDHLRASQMVLYVNFYQHMSSISSVSPIAHATRLTCRGLSLLRSILIPSLVALVLFQFFSSLRTHRFPCRISDSVSSASSPIATTSETSDVAKNAPSTETEVAPVVSSTGLVLRRPVHYKDIRR